MSRSILYCTFAIVGLGALAALGGEGEQKVALDQLPEPIQEAVKKRFPKATLIAAESETEDSVLLYEVALKNQKRKMDVTLTADGKFREIETQLSVNELPKLIAEAIEVKYPKATVTLVEEIIHVKDGKELKDAVEVKLLTAEKKSLEVVFDMSGRIVKTVPKGAGSDE